MVCPWDPDKSTPNCQVPAGLSSLPRPDYCNSVILLLLPFVLGHLSAVVTHLTLGHRNRRNKLRFWDKNHLKDSPNLAISWMPYNSLATAFMTVVQCVVMAVAVKASGLNISVGTLFIFFLTKPRVGWWIIMLSACFYEAFNDTATDVLLQECVLGVLALPGASIFLGVSSSGEMPGGCAPYDSFDTWRDGKSIDAILLLYSGSRSLIVCSAIFLVLGIFMVWKRRFLKRHLGLLAMIPCLGASVSAWILWTGFNTTVLDGDFCISGLAIGILCVISLAFPILNGLLRGWIGYPGGGGSYPY